MDSDGLDTWPYKDLVGQRISRMERGDTHTFAESRAQPFGRPGTTTAIEGRGPLEGPRTVWILTPPLCASVRACVCVWTVLLLQGWLDAL